MELMSRRTACLAKYDSPSAKAFPKEVIHPNLGPQYRNTVIGIVYHYGHHQAGRRAEVAGGSAQAAIQRQSGHARPSQHTTTAQWLASLHKVMGSKERADKFIRDLAATKPLLVDR